MYDWLSNQDSDTHDNIGMEPPTKLMQIYSVALMMIHDLVANLLKLIPTAKINGVPCTCYAL